MGIDINKEGKPVPTINFDNIKYEGQLTKSQIILENIKIYAHHGVLPEENKIGTLYIINVEIDTDLWKATQSDHLHDTINYAEINDIIHQEMSIKSQLLEHVAGRITSKIYEKFSQITHIKIKITKTAPPMHGETDGASIVLETSF